MSSRGFSIVLTLLVMVGIAAAMGFVVAREWWPGRVSINEVATLTTAEAKALQQRAVLAEKSAEIDRMAAESVRGEIVSLRQQVAEQQKDIEFYQGLMAPGSKRKPGIGIHDFNLSADGDRGYQYKLVVVQSGNGNRLLKGIVNQYIVGRSLRDGADSEQEQRLPVDLLPQFAGEQPAKLRFRFFQNLEGSFQLPSDFEPLRLEVDIRTTGKKPQKVAQIYRWADLLGEARE